ncbi:hypothetical protein [Bosea sp. LjRoot237]|uniref:hypothetical protein n=1 Tax=Bosea sp. LjRoot237 TaxID=3342292 RepID=UPI003ECD0958
MTAPRAINPTLRSFNSAIRAAQVWLMADAPAQALAALRVALGHANRIGQHARSMVLRVLCWVRAKVRAGK